MTESAQKLDELVEREFDSRIGVVELQSQRDEIIAKRRSIEAELASLNARVRSSNSYRTRLPDEEYRQICNRQAKLKRRLQELESDGFLIRSKLREAAALQNVDFVNRLAAMPHNSVMDHGSLPVLLRELQAKWQIFASDHTRINSMRLMAATFVSELEAVLSGDAKEGKG